LIASIQARGQSDGMREANAALETVRATRKQISLGDEPPALPPPPELKVGDRVQLRQMPSPGQLLSLSTGKAEVRVGSVVLWVPLADVTSLTKGEQRQIDRKQRADGRTDGRSDGRPDDRAGRREDRAGKKTDRRAQDALAEQGRASTGSAPRVRTGSNTLDLRGQRVEDALVAVEFFLDRMLSDRQPVAFLLHGHGTGALKQALRQFLPRCAPARSFRAADLDEGGDAFTFVEL
jgi:DNA mismatch repair protein MutS2